MWKCRFLGQFCRLLDLVCTDHLIEIKIVKTFFHSCYFWVKNFAFYRDEKSWRKLNGELFQVINFDSFSKRSNRVFANQGISLQVENVNMERKSMFFSDL